MHTVYKNTQGLVNGRYAAIIQRNLPSVNFLFYITHIHIRLTGVLIQKKNPV